MEDNNQVQNTEVTPIENASVEETTASSEEGRVVLEFSTVTNGVVTTQAQVGEEIKPTEEKKTVNVALLVFLLVIVLFAIIILLSVINHSSSSVVQVGVVKNNQMVFTKPVTGRTMDFNITDKLVTEVKIVKMEEEDIGTYVTFNIKYKGGRDSIKNCKAWLEGDDLLISFKTIGDSFIYQGDTKSDEDGLLIYVINPDKSVTTLDGADSKHAGMRIVDYVIEDKALIVNTTRANGLTTIKYDNEDDISICEVSITEYDETMIVEKSTKYELKDNVLDMSNPIVSVQEDLLSYVNTNRDLVCK